MVCFGIRLISRHFLVDYPKRPVVRCGGIQQDAWISKPTSVGTCITTRERGGNCLGFCAQSELLEG